VLRVPDDGRVVLAGDGDVFAVVVGDLGSGEA
jgi:hypothetical protein